MIRRPLKVRNLHKAETYDENYDERAKIHSIILVQFHLIDGEIVQLNYNLLDKTLKNEDHQNQFYAGMV